MKADEFAQLMAHTSALIEKELASRLRDGHDSGEIARVPELMQAMRHGTLNGGKRLRPFLVLETTRFCGGVEDRAVKTACAVELVHCYSLIHDDLPAMDNDDMRRGRPTVHKAFDEASAILAGDALLTFAFEMLAEDDRVRPEVRNRLVVLLAQAAGLGGMIGGQMLDIRAESAEHALTAKSVCRLQAMKTGALIRFACEAGAVIMGVDRQKRAALVRYGETVGLAFQLADDLLDVTASPEVMGKATRKDAGAGKATLVDLLGVDGARAELKAAVDEAEAVLAPYDNSETLVALAHFVANRTH